MYYMLGQGGACAKNPCLSFTRLQTRRAASEISPLSMLLLPVQKKDPKDYMNMRILHPGSKARDKGLSEALCKGSHAGM